MTPESHPKPFSGLPSDGEAGPQARLEIALERLSEAHRPAWPVPGAMHPIDRAFYEETVAQRDRAWQRIRELEAQVLTEDEREALLWTIRLCRLAGGPGVALESAWEKLNG